MSLQFLEFQMGWLLRLKERATHDKVGQVIDEQLGPIILNDGSTDGCWAAHITVQGRSVCCEIGGRFEPDPLLTERAREIRGSFDQFAMTVDAFLASEAARHDCESVAREIRSLVIRDVCLFWPDRPEDGMIFFDGADECRLWRCDLIERVPVGLGFDS